VDPGDVGRRLVSRPRASHEIIEVLRQDIATHRLPKGARLPNEREMARQFGVSQPTVREAIRALDAMGLVEVKHGSGAYVAADVDALVANSLETLLQIERVGILDVLEVRGVLGRYSAGLATRKADEDDISAIQKALDSIGGAGSVQELVEAVVSFQLTFAAASHNLLLLALESFLINMVVRFQLVALADRDLRFWRKWTANLHPARTQMLESLRKRDQQATVSAMTAYLEQQHAQFSANRALTEFQVSDPHWITKLTGADMRFQDYRASKPVREESESGRDRASPGRRRRG
jgi:GntR family transcriptional repressor for pyruvate dehydrogenase complex